MISLCLPLSFALSASARSDVELKFNFLDFPFVSFVQLGDRIGGPQQQVFDPMSQHRLGELSMCGFKKLLLHVTEEHFCKSARAREIQEGDVSAKK